MRSCDKYREAAVDRGLECLVQGARAFTLRTERIKQCGRIKHWRPLCTFVRMRLGVTPERHERHGRPNEQGQIVVINHTLHGCILHPHYKPIQEADLALVGTYPSIHRGFRSSCSL